MTNTSLQPVDDLMPLGASARNRWSVSATQANLVRPPVVPQPVTIDAGAKLVTFDLARTAIIVIDMQNDFCHPDGWLGHVGVDVTPVRAPISRPRLPSPSVSKRLSEMPSARCWKSWSRRSRGASSVSATCRSSGIGPLPSSASIR